MSAKGLSLVVVSNRLPFVVAANDDGKLIRKSSAGGLVTAVAPVVIETGGYWVGWPGCEMSSKDKIPEAAPDDKTQAAQLMSSKILPVLMSEEDRASFYDGMCNSTLWPLFHSMPGRATFDASAWKSYKSMNKIFAEKTMEALELQVLEDPGKTPVIWLQDYHLLLAAEDIKKEMVRRSIPGIITFFLHIPFPGFDIFKILPWENAILEGMLACDIIGFHDMDYCLNFLDCCHRGLGCRVDRKTLSVERNDGQIVHVKDMPISIHYNNFQEMAAKAKETPRDGAVQNILGVDRLDYTKGIPERLLAYKYLLEKYPEHRGKVKLLQIAVPSRIDVLEYKGLKEEIEQLVGSIQGSFSTATWSPLAYIHGGLPQSELVGLYRDADIALVTPLRDGMNLVAKEYVACQVNDPGVLILSPFAGAAKHMDEALLVNPYEKDNFASTIHLALKMPSKERMDRMNGLRAREETHDITAWLKEFMKSIEDFSSSKEILRKQQNEMFETKAARYLANRQSYALLLDFDGTLAPIVAHPNLAELPNGTKDLLEDLKSQPRVAIAIISGRELKDVRKKVNIRRITYSGGHGNEIRYPDDTQVTSLPDSESLQKLLKNLQKELNQYNGCWVEEKTFTLCVHIRHVAEDKMGLVTKAVQQIAAKAGYKTFPGHASIECKPKNSATKGTAVQHIMTHLYGREWHQNNIGAIYIGDDTTDEDAMIYLRGKGFSIRIDEDGNASKTTAADLVVPSARSVVHFLHWFLDRIKKEAMEAGPQGLNGNPEPIEIDVDN